MATALNSEDIVSHVTHKAAPIEFREGDWKACQQFYKRFQDGEGFTAQFDDAVAYKRACALAYLGRRAQIRGGVCNLTQPQVMTPKFVAELDSANRAMRYQRYPWLGTLMSLLDEIKSIQDNIASSSNVFSIVTSTK